jgi:kinesin family protein 5
LGNVIHALTSGNDHIPYRDSKLTRILQESLGGNYKTSLIVTCSTHSRNFDETLSTLNFAKREKKMKTNAIINFKSSPEQMELTIKLLKEELM